MSKHRRQQRGTHEPAGATGHPTASPRGSKRLLNRESVSQEYDVPVPTLATLVTRGGGPPFIKLGRRVYYWRDDVEKWLSQRTRHGARQGV
jgi:predicted DNA-binding transcriptional regulator AlpA